MANETCCAFVAMKTDPKMTREVYKKVSDFQYVKEAYTVTGRYDIMLRLECNSQNDLWNTLLDRVRGCPGVTHTETWTICER